jgi:hypothetical protein
LLSFLVSIKIAADTGGLGNKIMRVPKGDCAESVQCERPEVRLTLCLPDAEGEKGGECTTKK